MRIVLVSAVALIDDRGQILLAQRPEGKPMAGLWEFAGGKVEEGERPEDCLARELDEELGIKVDVSAFEALTFASHTYDDFHLLMPLFICREWQGEPHGREGQALVWVSLDELNSYEMPPADVPLVEKLVAFLK